MAFCLVRMLLDTKQDEAVKWGDSETPVEFKWSATGLGGVSQHEPGPINDAVSVN